MLIGNYSVLNKTCGSWRGGSTTSPHVQCRSNWNQNGSSRNMYTASSSGTAVMGKINTISSHPNGYGAGYAWILAQKPGGMVVSRGIQGSVSLGAGLLGGRNAVSELSGSGFVSYAAAAQSVGIISSLSGSGVLAGNIFSRLSAQASLTASGRVTFSNLLGNGNFISSIISSGHLANSISAKGSLDLEITVTGDLLTTANVGDAVWTKLTDGFYTAEDLLRIIAAVTAGKSSGGPNNPTFRDLSDTVDRVSGTADSNGNRSDIVYDVGD